jgi:hypothetical protein
VPQSQRERLRIHAGLVLASVICVSAFAFELVRALGGNTLSWAYVIEWPALEIYGIYMWKKLLRGDDVPAPAPAPLDEKTQSELDEWNAYLARVHGNELARSNPPVQEGQ